LPGQELDTDLANLQLSTEQVIDFLKLFTRSDGKLANGIVTQESLAASLRIGFDPPATWATGQTYTTRSTVFEGFGFYLCTVEHIAGLNFATDLGTGRWQLLADLTPPGGALIAANNLSDLADAAAARGNLGLGTVATDSTVPVVRGGTGATTAADALVNFGLTATASQINGAGQLAGRNRIINGQGRINQRGYVSGTATVGANQYTLDRWRVVTSGQSLTFTGTDAGRTMTAPAGGCEQVIEGVNIEGGTYVINWTGAATCTVNGTARGKGDTFTLTANTNATVRMVGGTFTDVQLELGALPTPFERLPISEELGWCERYYETGLLGMTAYQAAGSGFGATVPMRVIKRAVPSVAFSGITFINASSLTALDMTTRTFRPQAAATSLGVVSYRADYTLDAEL